MRHITQIKFSRSCDGIGFGMWLPFGFYLLVEWEAE